MSKIDAQEDLQRSRKVMYLLDGSNVNKILHVGQFALVSIVCKNETFFAGMGHADQVESASTVTR
jgi:hypothetical protein